MLQVTYITSLFPYVILLILLARGLTLEGSAQGVKFYLQPQWHRLASARVSTPAGDVIRQTSVFSQQ